MSEWRGREIERASELSGRKSEARQKIKLSEKPSGRNCETSMRPSERRMADERAADDGVAPMSSRPPTPPGEAAAAPSARPFGPSGEGHLP